MPTIVIRKDQTRLRGKVLGGHRGLLKFYPLGRGFVHRGSLIAVFASGEDRKRLPLSKGFCQEAPRFCFRFRGEEVVEVSDGKGNLVSEGDQYKLAIDAGLSNRDELLSDAARARFYMRPKLHAQLIQWSDEESALAADLPEKLDHPDADTLRRCLTRIDDQIADLHRLRGELEQLLS